MNFSTEEFPDNQRLAMLREHYGRTVLKAEIEITKDAPFQARIESHILPDLHLLSRTLSPATCNVGLEGVISGNWTAKIEYLYIDLGTVSGSFGASLVAPSGALATSCYSSQITDNILRAGIKYRFGGPVVAKY